MTTLNVTVGSEGLACVDMARPEVFNAFDEKMIEELAQTYADLGSRAAVRAIVLTGQGKAFSAGADLQWMKRASVANHADTAVAMNARSIRCSRKCWRPPRKRRTRRRSSIRGCCSIPWIGRWA